MSKLATPLGNSALGFVLLAGHWPPALARTRLKTCRERPYFGQLMSSSATSRIAARAFFSTSIAIAAIL